MALKEHTFTDVSREKAESKALAFMRKNANKFMKLEQKITFLVVTDEPDETPEPPKETKNSPKFSVKAKPSEKAKPHFKESPKALPKDPVDDQEKDPFDDEEEVEEQRYSELAPPAKNKIRATR